MKPIQDDAKKWRAESRRLKRELQLLTNAVLMALSILDDLMKKPSTPERGRLVARTLNQLEVANDSARHFGLHIRFKSKRWRGDKEIARSRRALSWVTLLPHP